MDTFGAAGALRLIDSHAHLTDERFDTDRAEVLVRAADTGVEAVVVIGHDLESSQQVVRLVSPGTDDDSRAPALFGTVGFAPHNVAEAQASARAEVQTLLSRPRIVGVGEIGLDYYYDMPPDEQRELFGEQLQWAVQRCTAAMPRMMCWR